MKEIQNALALILFILAFVFAQSVWYGLFALSNWSIMLPDWHGAARGVWGIGIVALTFVTIPSFSYIFRGERY